MDDMRLALILNAISPAIGGVLVRGEKGTAKSTAVRALTAVLPPVEVVAGCRFSCSPTAPDPQCPDGPHPAGAGAQPRPTPLVELPGGAPQDRPPRPPGGRRAPPRGGDSLPPRRPGPAPPGGPSV